MYYLTGGLLLFGLISFFRYLALYRLGTLAEKKRQKTESYDIGNFIKKCRNKNVQFKSAEGDQSQASQTKSKHSQHKLPLAPVISDSVLAGAAVFHQFMHIDDYMYEGISKISGEQIDNFSDLSSTVKEYSHNSDGLTEGALNKVKGHVAEEHVAAHFESAGATVEWPETSNQEGWDLLLNGNPVQVKLIKDTGALTEHFKEHPGIPAVIPSDAENIPDTAFHFDPSEGVGMESLTDFLKETPENAVIANHQLSHADMTENTEQATDFLTGDIDFFKLPLITTAFSSFREFRLLKKNDTDILSSFKNIALDVTGSGIGIGAGAATGATIGSVIPGIGTAVGAVVGSLAGGFFGRIVTDGIKEIPLEEAMEDWKKSTKKLKRKIKQSEKKYENQFKEEKEREQNRLSELSCEIKNIIDEKTRNLRKWTAEKEKPSETLKADLLSNIIDTTAFHKKENLHWTEYFWPKQKTINHQIKMKRIKKLLTEQFQKNTFTDRGRLFQKFAEHGLCREFILSEIQKTEEERLSRESDLIKEITVRQKQVLHERSHSIKKLADKIKDYAQEIRKELSPYIKETQSRQNLVKKEAKKLGRSA